MKKFEFKPLLFITLIGFACANFLSACKKDAASTVALRNTTTLQIPPVIVSTIAGNTIGGNAIGGSADGTGTNATFYQPFGITVDAQGNVYIADTELGLIRKITPPGVVTTIAGIGTSGYADGIGKVAAFELPYSIAVDGNGNLFVADTYNSVIRKITLAGVVTTIAGKAGKDVDTYTDGIGTAATFEQPWGIAVDASGNLFVTDKNAIRKITPGGVVTTFAGSEKSGSANGTGTSASFYGLNQIAIDAQGYVYVVDPGNYMVRKITPSGAVSTLAGNGTKGFTDGTGKVATFTNPTGITVGAKGNIYVTDIGLIREITPAGAVVTIAGDVTQTMASGTDGTGKMATFNRPRGITADVNGNLYVADTYDNMIRKIVFQ